MINNYGIFSIARSSIENELSQFPQHLLHHSVLITKGKIHLIDPWREK